MENKQVVERYIDERVAAGSMRGSTRINTSQVLRRLVADIDRPFTEVTTGDLIDWLGATHRDLAKGTRGVRLSMLRRFFGWMVIRGLRPDNPALPIERPRLPRTVPRAFGAETVALVLEHCGGDPRSELIVSLMLMEGLRAAEVAGLDVADINMSARSLKVTGKGDNERMLPISRQTMQAMRAYLATVPPTSWGPLVRSHKDLCSAIGAGYVSKLMSQLLYQAGVKRLPHDGVSGHALRHTCLSDTYEACHDLTLVQEMAGHTSVTTTQIYLRRANVGQLREVLEGRSYR